TQTDINLNDNGAVIVSAYEETNIKNVYAAGDCATDYHRVKQIYDYIPLGTTANKQGRIAGANMVNDSLTFTGIVGTSFITFFSIKLVRTEKTVREAQSLSINYKVQKTDAKSHAGYYPGYEKLTIKKLYHEETNELRDGQIIGAEGVDKRVDVLATALFNKMSMSDLIDLDLAYAPPYNSAWDTIQQMARKS